MVLQILFFVAVMAVVGWVNILCAGPLERSPMREFAHYMVMVGGGIAAFTGGLVIVGALLQ